MLEWLFLSLPVAAAYGWVMGRNSLRKAQQKQSSILSRHYYKGLNFLLSDEPDKAVDTLIKMISVNNDTVETHIAMGNFFRHRGELDRAIRVHQNLVNRDEISSSQQSSALLELGTDYLLAGFLERAEGVFLQLLESESHFQTAQKRLFSIYQITKEWGKAIELAARSIKVTPKETSLYTLLSHFYCEQAMVFLDESQFKLAEEQLQRAIETDENQVRAWLELGKIAIQKENYEDAFTFFSEIPKRDLDWLSEAIPYLEIIANHTGNDKKFEDFIEPYWKKCASSYIAKVGLMAKRGDSEKASRILTAQLQNHPTMRGFKRLLSLFYERSEDSETKQSLQDLQSLLDKQINIRPRYRCHSCGFSGRQLYWLCPSCKKWSVIKPIKGLDGE